jgi:protein-L-isoaspartate(D-aspartate) O-methyltransferase
MPHSNIRQVWREIVFSDRAAWMNGPMKFRCLRTQASLFAMLIAAGLATASLAQPDAAADRQHMVEEIGAMITATAGSSGISRLDPPVRAAMAEGPRHEFVPLEHRPAAYASGPLPIGHGQTISQPFIVALMTELLQLQKTHKVLEVGTGSGY